MTFEEYRRLDALDIASLVRKGEVTPSEILEIAIARAELVNPAINAINRPLYGLAREMANQVQPDAPFAGVPFLVKDLGIELQGVETSYGGKAYKGNVAKKTSYYLQKATQAGLVFVGKSNTPEFGLTPYTEPEAFGPTRNPWDTSRSAGGSSGGSAAGVAAGISPLASASDGGGSIRIPAANCGLFGLMPSRGRISHGPVSGELWMGAIREHCVSRTVRDSAAMLDVLQGYMPGDPYSATTAPISYLQSIQQEPGKLRIGFTTRHTLGHAIDPECVAAVQHSAQLLQSLGHSVEELQTLPFHKEDLTELFLVMVVGEAAASLREVEKFLGRPLKPSDVEATNFTLGLLGDSFTAREFAYHIRRWNELSQRMAQYHEQYDILLSPVVSTRPFQIGALQHTGAKAQLIRFVNAFRLKALVRKNVQQLGEEIFSYMPYTPIANMSGQPSMSVPLYWTDEQLPIGTMFTAAYGREDLLLQLARQLEQAQPWFDRIPA